MFEKRRAGQQARIVADAADQLNPVGRPLSPQLAGTVAHGVPSRVHMRLNTGFPV